MERIEQYTEQFKSEYNKAPYYQDGRKWEDYEPAYRYSYDQYKTEAGRKWDDVEANLENGWDKVKGQSKLAWAEAKEAVRDGWHKLERAMPGDADGDGR